MKTEKYFEELVPVMKLLGLALITFIASVFLTRDQIFDIVDLWKYFFRRVMFAYLVRL